jgi:hypothetical protein
LTEEQQKRPKIGTRASRKERGSGRRGLKGGRPERPREGPLTVFIHIPKTAGTTLTGVLRKNFPPGTVRVLGNVFAGAGTLSRGPLERMQRSGRVMTRDVHLLAGHIPFGVREFLAEDTRYITFLRDPVERTLSHYYRILTIHRAEPREGLTEDPSLEQMLEQREYLYDNLQTRMLSGDPEPFGEVTERMLEQAKENLDAAFLTFGLADRFDESLVLLKRKLGLRSMLYVTQRVTTERPRRVESKEEMGPVAERFNAYDIELYRWASERFDQVVAEQDSGFAVDLAALKAAVSGDSSIAPVPPASQLSRQGLWEQLVRARAELLGWEYDWAKTEPSDAVADLRDLLEDMSARLNVLAGGGGGKSAANGAEREDDDGTASRPRAGRAERLAAARERTEAHLKDLRGQIQELEEAVGDSSGDGDQHVLRELERLRGEAAELDEDLRQEDERLTEIRERTRAALTRKCESALGSLERSERRLETVQRQLRELEPTASGQEGEARNQPRLRVPAKIKSLQGLIVQREGEVAEQRERLAAIERELRKLDEEAVDEAVDTGAPADADVSDDVPVAPTG